MNECYEHHTSDGVAHHNGAYTFVQVLRWQIIYRKGPMKFGAFVVQPGSAPGGSTFAGAKRPKVFTGARRPICEELKHDAAKARSDAEDRENTLLPSDKLVVMKGHLAYRGSCRPLILTSKKTRGYAVRMSRSSSMLGSHGESLM